eukprot:1931682-Rhodomonas_salina.3
MTRDSPKIPLLHEYPPRVDLPGVNTGYPYPGTRVRVVVGNRTRVPARVPFEGTRAPQKVPGGPNPNGGRSGPNLHETRNQAVLARPSVCQN